MSRALSFLHAVWKNRRRQADLPRVLTYIVTFTCNARCVMCDSWKKPSPGELTLAEIERIFGELPRMDAVRLSGGEPFVRRDLPEIVRLAQEKLRPLFLHARAHSGIREFESRAGACASRSDVVYCLV